MRYALCHLDPINSMPRPFYSLPPAGKKIPLSLLFKAMIGGSRNGGLEKSSALKEIIGNALCLYLSSGRAALWLILKALSELNPKKRKVIIPAYTCPAVASAVLKAGLQPVLCDVNLDDFGYCADDLERTVDEGVLALIVVHLFGFPANIDQVTPMCREHDVYLVEDAAQAFGNELSATGIKLGTIGDVGFFSFGRGKPLSAIHGGLVVTKSKTVYKKAFEIYENLSSPSSLGDIKYFSYVGFYDILSSPYLYWIPQKIPSMHLGETIFEPDFSLTKGLKSSGSIIEGLLDSLESGKKDRKAKSEWFNKELPEREILRKPHCAEYPFHRYPLLIENRVIRDAIIKELKSIGISGALFYPCPLNELPGLRDILQDNRTYTNAKQLSDSLITLPVHEGVTEHDIIRILRVIKSIVA